MRAVVQRVTYGGVRIGGEVVAAIGPGLVILLGVGEDDAAGDAEYLAAKIASLRVFPDHQGRMNLSLAETGGEALVVSQFTLYGDCRHGRRPSFIRAAAPEPARVLYQLFVTCLAAQGIKTATGQFQAMMQVEIHNDGPVTLLLDSRKEF
ncbi:MAG: D-tyrosyl-tRNA(Tyr) deacylase [Clostridia bacterium]|nr:MAG: D-tyrosyl-tRNA(Tyr) deacylase [Clostridia bacterium]